MPTVYWSRVKSGSTRRAAWCRRSLGSPLAPVTLKMKGNTSADGPDGNIRTFSSGSVSVNVSGFSREKANPTWQAAWLGAYVGGVGVTDPSEDGSNDSHTIDNISRDNYVLFEFNQPVIVDSTFLGYVTGDSDMNVWIGTISNAFNNHITLSDAVLASLGFTEVNDTTSSGLRTADINAGKVVGNVMVVSARRGGDSKADRFKINTLRVAPSPGIYENKATVTAGGEEDSDLSHYRNSTESQSGLLGPGMTGAISFWQNSDGQALIKSLNGSSTAKKLGNWLASKLPGLFGSGAGTGNNLSGKTNLQVAAYFQQVFAVSRHEAAGPEPCRSPRRLRDELHPRRRNLCRALRLQGQHHRHHQCGAVQCGRRRGERGTDHEQVLLRVHFAPAGEHQEHPGRFIRNDNGLEQHLQRHQRDR